MNTTKAGKRNLKHCAKVLTSWGLRVVVLERLSRWGCTDIMGADLYAEPKDLQLWVQVKSDKYEGRRSRTVQEVLKSAPKYRYSLPLICWPEGQSIDFYWPDETRHAEHHLQCLRGNRNA